MSIYLGNTAIGNGNYLGNLNIRDSNIFMSQSVVAPVDPDAAAFITATGISGSNATAIDTLVLDLKSAGVWNGLYAIYPMIGGTSTTCKYNLKDPQDTNGAYRLNFVGGWTFDSSGAKPDGVSGTYADTFAAPNSVFTTTNGSFSYYSFTNNAASDDVEFGASPFNSTTGETLLALRYSDGNQYSFFGQVGGSGGASGNSSGYFISNRTSAVEGWKNGTRVVNTGTTVTTFTTNTLYLGAQNNSTSNFRNSSRGCSFATIGATLSDPAGFSTIVNNYQTALGRNVY
jgi:hypothetical protein